MAELTYDLNATAIQMAQTIFGSGVTVNSATYTGDSRSSAIYSDADTISPGVAPSDSGVILSTGYADSFTRSSGDVNSSTSTSTNTSGPSDSDFNAMAGTTTYDASILEVNFTPVGDTMTLTFVFASEEYPEYINSNYNDFFGIWVNGTPATVNVGDGSASVSNVNGGANDSLYIDNTGDSYNTEMDGFTVTMSVTFPVNAGVPNTLKIGVADVSDTSYDSNVLIAADSVQTALIATDDDLQLKPGKIKEFDLTQNDTNTAAGSITITKVNGIDVVAGDTVTLSTGQSITLNPDGTVSIDSGADIEQTAFTYTIENSAGDSSVGVVDLNVACFVAGTLIDTPEGLRPVEVLRPGDLVMTQDAGAQPLIWSGSKTVPAHDNFAPIRFSQGTLGANRDLLLSPQHRVLVCDPMAELLFDSSEVLIAAKNLVNGTTITRCEGGMVTYVHILFDCHHIVFSEGIATESFLPGPMTMGGLEADLQAEILTLFPELCPLTGDGFGPPARPLLRSFESNLLQGRAA
ncbi:choice-of-anchor L domain-containing protein [Thioclava sp.]|uniref:choice-of-anchor L domain-containing protein n=1 Tax=Thioclava sp. TaxID=1933450 RepID=UPI003AA7C6D4